jgi:hypothetical protein
MTAQRTGGWMTDAGTAAETRRVVVIGRGSAGTLVAAR